MTESVPAGDSVTEVERLRLLVAVLDERGQADPLNKTEVLARAEAAEAKLAAIREFIAPRARLNADYDDILAILDGAR